MKNTMDDLRNHLFETIEALKDDDKPMEIDRALAIAKVASQVIETAKVEVAFLKVTDADGDSCYASPNLKQLGNGKQQGVGERK